MKSLLKNKKWTISFIVFTVLFNIPFYSFADNLMRKEIILSWFVNLLVSASLCVIAFCLKGKAERRFLIILCLLSLVPNLVVFSYLFIANMHMSSDMFWVIFATNYSESYEYFDQSIPLPLALCIVGYALFSGFLLFKAYTAKTKPVGITVRKHKFLFSFSILLIVAMFSIQYLSQMTGTIDFYKSSVRFFLESYRMQQEASLRKNENIDVKCKLNPDQGNTFVVVIGESLSRNHMHIYDYPRETTPNLDAMKDSLYVYKDVVSPNTHTIAVLKNVLTFANHEHPNDYLQKPSIIDLFNDAGFKTYWISTQEMAGKWGGSYSIIANESDSVINLSEMKQPDGIALPKIYSLLDENTNQNRIIFVHIMGSHNAYKFRYPKEFEYFSHKTQPIPDKPYLDDKKKTVIDEYDNSVRYTDYFVSSIIKKMQEKTDRSSFFLFFSDHGEEVYDYRDVVGHFISGASRYQCEVPLILWCSDAYKKEDLGLTFQTDRPFSSEDLIHSISDLSGLEYKEFQPKLSLFNKQFVPKTRQVGTDLYEDIVKRTNQFKSK